MAIEERLSMVAIERRRRRLCAAKCSACARHMRAFASAEIDMELDVQLLEQVCAVMKGPPHYRQTAFSPHRGARGNAIQTPIIVAGSNRSARLKAADVGGNSPPAE